MMKGAEDSEGIDCTKEAGSEDADKDSGVISRFICIKESLNPMAELDVTANLCFL